MTEQEQKEFDKLKRQKEKQLTRQNQFFAANYDRIAFVLPKGSREKIRQHYKQKGLDSLADIFKYLLTLDGFQLSDMDRKPEE